MKNLQDGEKEKMYLRVNGLKMKNSQVFVSETDF